MPVTIGNCGISPGSAVTLNDNIIYTKGGIQAGCEGEIAFGTVDQLSAPFCARVVNKQLVLKGTSAEVAGVILEDIWGEVTAASLGLPTTVTPASHVASAVFANGTFTITTAVATDFGDVSADESDINTNTFTFKGISADGAAAQGSWVDLV